LPFYTSKTHLSTQIEKLIKSVHILFYHKDRKANDEQRFHQYIFTKKTLDQEKLASINFSKCIWSGASQTRPQLGLAVRQALGAGSGVGQTQP